MRRASDIQLLGLRLALMLLIAAAGAGCAARSMGPGDSAAVSPPPINPYLLNPSLIMPHLNMPHLNMSHRVVVMPDLVVTGEDQVEPVGAEAGYGWEYARNDHLLGGAGMARIAGFRAVEIRHREHLRTINSRPREFSTTTTRTIERRFER